MLLPYSCYSSSPCDMMATPLPTWAFAALPLKFDIKRGAHVRFPTEKVYCSELRSNVFVVHTLARA